MKSVLLRKFSATSILLGLLLCSSQSLVAQQNIVQDGSFESRWPFEFWWGIGVCYECGGGAADGRNYASINSLTQFAVQTLSTVPGQAYHVSFASFATAGQPSVQLRWDLTILETTPWINPNYTHGPTQFAWTYREAEVVATSTSTPLYFLLSSGSTGGGTLIDDVRVVPIPEPSSIGLISLCAGAVLAARIRRLIRR